MKKNLQSAIYISLFFLTSPLAQAAQATDFMEGSQLETEMKAYCLKNPVTKDPAQISVYDSTSRQSVGVHFESIRFGISKKAIDGQYDCKAEREIAQIVDGNKKIKLFDTGFYAEPYCQDPVRFSQAPIVYEMKDAGTGKDSDKKRKLAIIEFVSATLPCPDTDDVKVRHFVIFDLANPEKPLLDIQADFVIPEIGNETYRLHLVNVSKVLQSPLDHPADQRPTAVELKAGQFSISWMPAGKDKKPKHPAKSTKNRTALNAIYSKDQKNVYYDTGDEGGKIEGADPATFELLNPAGDSAYTKDAKKVYFFGKALTQADAATFVQMNERYGKDINHVYFMENVLADADLASFTAPFQNVWYAKDKDHVFSGKKIFQLADPGTFSTGPDRSCGSGCSYRSEDKNSRFDGNDHLVQKLAPAGT